MYPNRTNVNTPTIEPIAIPAFAPVESPPPSPADEEAEGAGEEVGEVVLCDNVRGVGLWKEEVLEDVGLIEEADPVAEVGVGVKVSTTGDIVLTTDPLVMTVGTAVAFCEIWTVPVPPKQQISTAQRQSKEPERIPPLQRLFPY